MKFNLKTLVHDSFEVSIAFKAFVGVLQVAGAIALFLIRPHVVSHWILWITDHELLDDPRDFIANHLVAFSQSFTHQSQIFAALYLASHGLIKLFLIWNLWKKRMWAYPAAITVFVLFGVYQIYRYFITHSVGMIILTVLDAIVIALTYLEYQNLENTKLDV